MLISKVLHRASGSVDASGVGAGGGCCGVHNNIEGAWRAYSADEAALSQTSRAEVSTPMSGCT